MRRNVVLLVLTLALLSVGIAPGLSQPAIVSTTTCLGPTVYNDLIAFAKDVYPDNTLMIYRISTATLTDTGIGPAYFPSVYQNLIAFATITTREETYIGLYDVSTSTLKMIFHQDPGNIIDFTDWNLGGRAVSIDGNIIAFWDYEGIWYYNIASASWTQISSSTGPKWGISIRNNIIAFSAGPSGSQTISYYNVSGGTTTETGINGLRPSMGQNLIAFDWNNTIFYYNIDTGILANTGAAGKQASIWSDLIAFTTYEGWTGLDMNADGDMDDYVIRYYNLSSDLVTNTGETGESPSLWGRATFTTKEGDLGVDVNGDGDFEDLIARLLNIRVPGDLNDDGVVNIADLSVLSAHWSGPPTGLSGYSLVADINYDGEVNLIDSAILSAYWTGPPKGPLVP